jgi:hypothetical protein
VIVRNAGGVLHLITQRDHARLARRVMDQCVPLSSLERRVDILHAIAEHDNGWADVDAAPVIDPASGRPADFISLPLPERHGVWPRGVARLAERPYAAALVAHHAVTVYSRYRRDPAWTAFFSGMEAARHTMLHLSGVPHDVLDSDYVWLRLGDLISLAFCTVAAEPLVFGAWTVGYDGATVNVAPDIFGGSDVPFDIDACEIDDRRYADDADLREAVRRGRSVRLEGVVTGQRMLDSACASAILFPSCSRPSPRCPPSNLRRHKPPPRKPSASTTTRSGAASAAPRFQATANGSPTSSSRPTPSPLKRSRSCTW